MSLGSAQALGGTGTLASVGTISFGGGALQFSAANQTDYSSRFSQGANQKRIDRHQRSDCNLEYRPDAEVQAAILTKPWAPEYSISKPLRTDGLARPPSMAAPCASTRWVMSIRAVQSAQVQREAQPQIWFSAAALCNILAPPLRPRPALTACLLLVMLTASLLRSTLQARR